MKKYVFVLMVFFSFGKMFSQKSVAILDDQGIEFGYQYMLAEGKSYCNGRFYKLRSYIKNKTNKNFRQVASVGSNTIIYKVLMESPGSKGDMSYNNCDEVASWGSHNRWNWTNGAFFVPGNSTVYSIWETYSIKDDIEYLKVSSYDFAKGQFQD